MPAGNTKQTYWRLEDMKGALIEQGSAMAMDAAGRAAAESGVSCRRFRVEITTTITEAGEYPAADA